ncbi:MAG TPA: DUF6428 family protein [Meiothermus sp.]|nr:DUF6428 family protein [Meiothermus sp.]
MDTRTFLETLQAHPDKALVFEYGPGKQLQPGYHVTEVMNVTYESMDCGGQANFWRETIVQLMGPGAKDAPEFMPVKKFLSIYHRVAASVPVRADAEIRFEYGNAEIPAIHYHIGSIAEEAGHLVVRLAQPGVTCKANDRAVAQGCCTPAPIELEVGAVAKGTCCG